MSEETRPSEGQLQNGIVKIIVDIGKDCDRLRRVAEPTTKKLNVEMIDTVLPTISELAQQMLHVSNWIEAALSDVDGRLGALEDEETVRSLSPEEGYMILQLAARCEQLAVAVMETPNIGEVAKQELYDTVALCKRVVGWAEDAVSGEDEGSVVNSSGSDGVS